MTDDDFTIHTPSPDVYIVTDNTDNVAVSAVPRPRLRRRRLNVSGSLRLAEGDKSVTDTRQE